MQEMLIANEPAMYFKPPYVGPRGWVGIELKAIDDEDLANYLREAWLLIAPKKLQALFLDGLE
jgi:hypothetical protein